MRLNHRGAALLIALTACGFWAGATRASDDTRPAARQNPAPDPQKAKTTPGTPATFQGEVVRVQPGAAGNEGKIWVKHADGTLKLFHVHSTTKLTGAPALKAVTKGSMVTVEATKHKAVLVNVTKLAAPTAPDKVQGDPVSGTVVKVRSDAYGDTGSIWVKPASGAVKEFQVTNATHVEHPGHKDAVHSLQFVKSGQSVTIEHDGGKTALVVEVTAVPSKK
jgi:hypothetical protein